MAPVAVENIENIKDLVN